jgi:hypothetical protein
MSGRPAYLLVVVVAIRVRGSSRDAASCGCTITYKIRLPAICGQELVWLQMKRHPTYCPEFMYPTVYATMNHTNLFRRGIRLATLRASLEEALLGRKWECSFITRLCTESSQDTGVFRYRSCPNISMLWVDRDENHKSNTCTGIDDTPTTYIYTKAYFPGWRSSSFCRSNGVISSQISGDQNV